MSLKKPESFYSFLIISLVGNACADYALLWFSITNIDEDNKLGSVSSFYIGQAIGAIILAQVISVYFDKYRKKISSIALDSTYSLVLLIMVFLYNFKLLNSSVILIATCILTALSTVHRSAVGYSLIQSISTPQNLTTNVTKFTSSLALSQLLGAGISGVIYSSIGFVGCMVIGILTFIPLLLTYNSVFGNEEPDYEKSLSQNFFNNYKSGLKSFISDKTILAVAVSIGILNIVSSVIPSIVGIALKSFQFNESYFLSITISTGLLLGIIFNKYFSTRFQNIKLNQLISISILPSLLILIMAEMVDSPIPYVLFFLAGCVGSSLRNVSTGVLRTKRISKEMIGRVNTIYTTILYSGQIIGGLLIVPMVQNDLRLGTIAITVTIIIAIFFSLLLLPNKRFSEL